MSGPSERVDDVEDAAMAWGKMSTEQVDALVAEAAKVDDEELTAYKGGWKGSVGTALVDAVFSIRAQYEAKDPTKGVVGRLRTFNVTHPEAMNDLSALVALGETELRNIMGRGSPAHNPRRHVSLKRPRLSLPSTRQSTLRTTSWLQMSRW